MLNLPTIFRNESLFIIRATDMGLLMRGRGNKLIGTEFGASLDALAAIANHVAALW